ncbi:hypothetical protein RB653_001099 [Dictyostelium firmibasis]|uniref:Fucosyltransferase n=1 Tax=Dictyostelium firmibasis TaxID=79012 RepID=A0AAN7YUY3_9MYCE
MIVIGYNVVYFNSSSTTTTSTTTTSTTSTITTITTITTTTENSAKLKLVYGNYFNMDENHHKNSNIYNLDNDDPYRNTFIEGEGEIKNFKELNISSNKVVYFDFVGKYDGEAIDIDIVTKCKGLDNQFYYLVRKPNYQNHTADMEIFNDYLSHFQRDRLNFGKNIDLPKTLIGLEPQPLRTCEFNETCVEYFNFKISFESNSDIRFGFDTPISSSFQGYKELSLHELLKIKNQFQKEYQEKKLNNTLESHQSSFPLVNWFCTNCQSFSNRNEYVQELMKYIVIDSYGKCLNNIPTSDYLKRESGDPFERKKNILSKYKFTIVFENSLCQDYVSEKVLDALVAGSVPIFMAHPSTIKYLPYRSFIFVGDFNSAEELANFLKYLDRNQEEYNKYHAWRTNQTAIEQWKGVNNYPNKPGFRFPEFQCPLLRHFLRFKNNEIPLKKLKYVPFKSVCLPSDYFKI